MNEFMLMRIYIMRYELLFRCCLQDLLTIGISWIAYGEMLMMNIDLSGYCDPVESE